VTSRLVDSTAVLGGSGFLGAHVVRSALGAGPGAVLSISRAPIVPGAGLGQVRAVAADALREGELERALDAERPARIVLCTALSRISECDEYEVLAHKLNVELPWRVANWCGERGARLVHVSTDLVFGEFPPPPRGFLEHHVPAPLNRYGETKALGEFAVLAADPRALVVRLPLLFGDSFGRGFGASDSLLAALERGERPLLFTDEWRTPLDAADAARALIELAHSRRAGLLHVAGERKLDRHTLALEILRARGLSEGEARSKVRAGRRSDAGLGETRPADVALASSYRSARGKMAARG
jgi:dTDP-4-dehydrorhamnose reductase